MLLYHHKTLNKTIHESATAVINEVLVFWDKAKIPVRPQHHAIKQLETLHDKWQKLKKNSKRTSATQKSNEEAFSDQLGDLFDIAHQDALSLLKNQEDRDFLLAQREKGCMGAVDNVHSAKETRRKQRQDKEYNRLKQSQSQEALMNEMASLTGSSEDTGRDSLMRERPHCFRLVQSDNC